MRRNRRGAFVEKIRRRFRPVNRQLAIVPKPIAAENQPIYLGNYAMVSAGDSPVIVIDGHGLPPRVAKQGNLAECGDNRRDPRAVVDRN